MSRYLGILIVGLLAQAAAAQPSAPSPSPAPVAPSTAAPAQGIGDQGESGLGQGSSLNPQMVGDLGRRGYRLISPNLSPSFSPLFGTPSSSFLSPSGPSSAVVRLPVVAPARG